MKETRDFAVTPAAPGKQKLTQKQNALQAIKFTMFSISAGLIQTITFALLKLIPGIPYWVSYLTALTLSVLWNFTFNRKFTFKSANNVPVAMLKVAAYYLVFTPLSTWWGDALVDGRGWNDFLVLAGTMLINFVTEFLYDRYVVFGKSINTNELGKKEQQNAMEADGKP